MASPCRALLVLLRTLDFILQPMMCFTYRVMISSVLLRAFWLRFEARLPGGCDAGSLAASSGEYSELTEPVIARKKIPRAHVGRGREKATQVTGSF